MIRLLRTLGASLSVLMLASCANVSSDFRLDGAKQGLLVGTMTTEIGQASYHLKIVDAATGANAETHPRFGSSMAPAIPPMRDQALAQDGSTFAIALDPGRYAFTGWWRREGYGESASRTPFSIPFVIEAGKATYLGNAHWRRNWRLVLSDQAERDLPILRSRYAALSQAPIAFGIEPGTEVVGLGGDSSTQMKIPVFVAIPLRR